MEVGISTMSDKFRIAVGYGYADIKKVIPNFKDIYEDKLLTDPMRFTDFAKYLLQQNVCNEDHRMSTYIKPFAEMVEMCEDGDLSDMVHFSVEKLMYDPCPVVFVPSFQIPEMIRYSDPIDQCLYIAQSKDPYATILTPIEHKASFMRIPEGDEMEFIPPHGIINKRDGDVPYVPIELYFLLKILGVENPKEAYFQMKPYIIQYWN